MRDIDCVLELCDNCDDSHYNMETKECELVQLYCDYCICEIENVLCSCVYCSKHVFGSVNGMERKPTGIRVMCNKEDLDCPDVILKSALLSRNEGVRVGTTILGGLGSSSVNQSHNSPVNSYDLASLSRGKDNLARVMNPTSESMEPDIVFDSINGFDRYKNYALIEKHECYTDRSNRQWLGGIATFQPGSMSSHMRMTCG